MSLNLRTAVPNYCMYNIPMYSAGLDHAEGQRLAVVIGDSTRAHTLAPVRNAIAATGSGISRTGRLRSLRGPTATTEGQPRIATRSVPDSAHSSKTAPNASHILLCSSPVSLPHSLRSLASLPLSYPLHFPLSLLSQGIRKGKQREENRKDK